MTDDLDDDEIDDFIDDVASLPTSKKVAIVAGVAGFLILTRGRGSVARRLLHFSAKGIGSFGTLALLRAGGHGPANASIGPHAPQPRTGPVPQPPPAPLDLTAEILAAARAILLRTYSRAISGAIAADQREGIGSARVGVSMKVLTAADRRRRRAETDERNAVRQTIQNGFVDLTAAILTPDP